MGICQEGNEALRNKFIKWQSESFVVDGRGKIEFNNSHDMFLSIARIYELARVFRDCY